MKATEVETVTKMVTRRVRLVGVTPIMFDRYAGDNDTKLLWTQKIYLRPRTAEVSLPVDNIVSFLCSHNTNSAPKRLRDARKYKSICNACLAFVVIGGDTDGYIAFRRDDSPIVMGTPNNESDAVSGVYLHRAVARLDKGIPNPKERPVLPLPWALEFELSIIPNREIKEQEVRNLFEEGGLAVGLGTYRGRYGKFMIDRWE
jgi:hypothetical protein